MTAPIRVFVVDDEPLAREGVAALVREDPELALVGTSAGGPEGVDRLLATRPELLLLDVQMPVLDGFGFLEAIGDENLPVVVFVTAYEAHALRAFDVNAVDYLLKPFDNARFATAIARAKTRVREQRERPSPEPALRRLLDEIARQGGGVSRLIVREVGRITIVPVGTIDWIEGANYYARLHVGGKAHLLRETLQSLERRLDPRRFLRIQRSVIVNLERITGVETGSHGAATALLAGGARLKVSARAREELERRLEELPG